MTGGSHMLIKNTQRKTCTDLSHMWVCKSGAKRGNCTAFPLLCIPGGTAGLVALGAIWEATETLCAIPTPTHPTPLPRCFLWTPCCAPIKRLVSHPAALAVSAQGRWPPIDHAYLWPEREWERKKETERVRIEGRTDREIWTEKATKTETWTQDMDGPWWTPPKDRRKIK